MKNPLLPYEHCMASHKAGMECLLIQACFLFKFALLMIGFLPNPEDVQHHELCSKNEPFVNKPGYSKYISLHQPRTITSILSSLGFYCNCCWKSTSINTSCSSDIDFFICKVFEKPCLGVIVIQVQMVAKIFVSWNKLHDNFFEQDLLSLYHPMTCQCKFEVLRHNLSRNRIERMPLHQILLACLV